MSQAKTLTTQELEHVLDFVKTKRYPERDRAMVLTSF